MLKICRSSLLLIRPNTKGLHKYKTSPKLFFRKVQRFHLWYKLLIYFKYSLILDLKFNDEINYETILNSNIC